MCFGTQLRPSPTIDPTVEVPTAWMKPLVNYDLASDLVLAHVLLPFPQWVDDQVHVVHASKRASDSEHRSENRVLGPAIIQAVTARGSTRRKRKAEPLARRGMGT